MTYLFYFIFHPVRRSSCSMQSFNKKTMSDQLVIVPFKYSAQKPKSTYQLFRPLLVFRGYYMATVVRYQVYRPGSSILARGPSEVLGFT